MAAMPSLASDAGQRLKTLAPVHSSASRYRRLHLLPQADPTESYMYFIVVNREWVGRGGERDHCEALDLGYWGAIRTSTHRDPKGRGRGRSIDQTAASLGPRLACRCRACMLVGSVSRDQYPPRLPPTKR